MSAMVDAFEPAPSLGENDRHHGVDANAVVSLQSLAAGDEVEKGGAS